VRTCRAARWSSLAPAFITAWPVRALVPVVSASLAVIAAAVTTLFPFIITTLAGAAIIISTVPVIAP
jgi:hypothetical protein